MVVLKFKVCMQISNKEAFPIIVNLLPFGSSAIASLANANYGTDLGGQSGAKTLILAAATLPNSIKTVTFAANVASLEGVSPQLLFTSPYWATYLVRATNYQGFYVQSFSQDLIATFTTGLGIRVHTTAWYTVGLLQPSVTTSE